MDPFDPTILRRSFEPEITKYRKLFARLASVNSAQYELQEEAHIASLTENKYLQLSGYIRQAKKKGYRTWIAFDNVDRGSASYQKFVYSFAHQLATSAGCVTLITLREDTFLEAKAAGFLDVRTSDRVFQLVAPELKQVISRRRKYVERSIERNEVPAIFKQHTNTIARLNAHISLLFLQNDESLRLLLTSFSLRNIRYGLDLIRSYYMSYHSTFHTSRLLQEEGTSKGVSRFSGDAEELERFIQSLMLGNSWAYQEGSSEVFNIFAVDPLEQTSHFLLLRILAYLRIDHNMSSRPTVRYERLLSDFVWLGYQRHHINGAITRLISNGLLVSPNLRTISHIEMLDMSYAEIKIAISAKGVYYLERLAGNSYYQLRVAEDTIWYDEELAKIYIKSLQDWAVSQGRDDAQDLLQATNARETFLLYLRRSLLNEYRDSNQRRSSRQWAIIVDDMVETRIFGEKVSQSVYLSESDVTGTGEVLPSNTSKSPRKSGREHMKSLLAQPAETGYLQSELQFPGVAEASATDLMRESLKRLGQLPRGAKVGKSQYPVKVLWALELASFAGLMQLRASEISQIINSFGSGTVEATNVARFLRQQRLIGEYSHLWSEPSPGFFSINSTGQDVLKAIMKKEKRTKSSPKKRNN